LEADDKDWLDPLLALETPPSSDTTHTNLRVQAIVALVKQYLPWLQPKFRTLLTKANVEEKPLRFYTPQTACGHCRTLVAALEQMQPEEKNSNVAMELGDALYASEQRLTDLIATLRAIAAISERMFQDTDCRVMLDPYRRLLSIGYDTENDRLLNSCYDLLASEARTAMFLAIGKGDILQETWFRVARKTTLINGTPVLMSWSGTMFEYMMPTLWMQTSPETLLAQSLPLVVTAQRQFIGRRRMPWGISEASHSERDPQGNYQYHAFGVPTLALNPPPRDYLVIAPYASVLALEADRGSALANLYEMEKMGWLGEFGFYESADYSATTQHPAGSKYTLVRSWMAHHQGMSLLAITNLLADKPFQHWFHADPRVRATELLLHEKPAQIAPAQDVPRTAKSIFQPSQQSI